MMPDLRLANGLVDLVVTIDRGPRVLRYGFVGGDNMFADVPSLSTTTALGEWKPWGGHRLWVAPEMMPGSYAPDAEPVAHEMAGPTRAVFHQRPDASGIEKTLTVDLSAADSHVAVTHTITNRTCWPIRVAAWAITAVVPDGTAVIPQPPRRPHTEDVRPARSVTLWSYTDLADRRWSIGEKLIRLTPDPAQPGAQKIGVANEHGWCALVKEDTVFMKHFAPVPGERYPHFGSNNEVFTAANYLEIETLGPLRVIEPGESTVHVERWTLHRGHIGASDAEQHAALAAMAARVG